MQYHLEASESASEEDRRLIFSGLLSNAKERKGMEPMRTVSVMVKTADNKSLGGLTGNTFYGCLYVGMLWIDPSIRKLGIGSKLMQEAEKIAKSRGCTFATVNTMDFEALPFYQKLGYEVEFVRKGFEKDSSAYMLRKSL